MLCITFKKGSTLKRYPYDEYKKIDITMTEKIQMFWMLTSIWKQAVKEITFDMIVWF